MIPWAYTRDQLAQEWKLPPPLIDLLPRREIALKLELWTLEAEASQG